MHGQQAKIVSPTQEQAMRGSLATTRYPSQDRVMFLLSIKVGLCAKEMASLTWAMVTDAQGQVAEVMHVANRPRDGRPWALAVRAVFAAPSLIAMPGLAWGSC
jgi:integrase/recombinase XerD